VAARRYTKGEERFTDSSYVGAAVTSVRYRSYREIERLRLSDGDMSAVI
jgi:hypothetical protein